MNDVTIVDVVPRDGFQSVPEPISTDTKVATIEALIGAGIRRIEAGAFVSPKHVPQMSDAAAVWARVRHHRGLRFAFLVPNAHGAALALEHGVQELGWVFSASAAHNRANVRREVAQSIAELASFWRGLGSSTPRLRLNLSTCFDCPFDGRVPEAAVIDAVARCLEFLVEVEVGICDTTGRAMPDHVERLFTRLREGFDRPGLSWAFHGHDTYGLGVANVLAALRAGVCVFDGSAGGLGGCPFAPGASGNTASEDIVFTLQNMGLQTGVSLPKLLQVADAVVRIPGVVVGGHVRELPRERVLAA